VRLGQQAFSSHFLFSQGSPSFSITCSLLIFFLNEDNKCYFYATVSLKIFV